LQQPTLVFEATYGFLPDMVGGSNPAPIQMAMITLFLGRTPLEMNLIDFWNCIGEMVQVLNHELKDGRALRKAEIEFAEF